MQQKVEITVTEMFYSANERASFSYSNDYHTIHVEELPSLCNIPFFNLMIRFCSDKELEALIDALILQKFHLKLLSLDIRDNQLTSLPESLGQLAALTHLNCAVNALIAFPESLSQLTKLQHLNCEHNMLTALPDSLGNLSSLQWLQCNNNQLTVIPESLGQLTALTYLNCGRNPLTSLPMSLGLLTTLQTLQCDYSQLTSLPQSLTQLTALNILNCCTNKLTALPEPLNQLTALTELNCSFNQITYLPASLGQLSSLRNLTCEYNQLTYLSGSMGQLVLHAINITDNPFTVLPIEALTWPILRNWSAEFTFKQVLKRNLLTARLLSSLLLEGSRLHEICVTLCQMKLEVIRPKSDQASISISNESISAQLFFCVMGSPQLLLKILSHVTADPPREVGFTQMTDLRNNAAFIRFFKDTRDRHPKVLPEDLDGAEPLKKALIHRNFETVASLLLQYPSLKHFSMPFRANSYDDCPVKRLKPYSFACWLGDEQMMEVVKMNANMSEDLASEQLAELKRRRPHPGDVFDAGSMFDFAKLLSVIQVYEAETESNFANFVSFVRSFPNSRTIRDSKAEAMEQLLRKCPKYVMDAAAWIHCNNSSLVTINILNDSTIIPTYASAGNHQGEWTNIYPPSIPPSTWAAVLKRVIHERIEQEARNLAMQQNFWVDPCNK